MNRDKNDVVIVELDRPRELRFGHKALKKMAALSGKSFDEMGGDEIDLGDLEDIEKIFYYGLERDARENGETLTLEMMEDILDYAPSYAYLVEKLQQAITIATQGFDMGNLPTPASPAQKQTQRRGTGRKA